MAKVFYMGLQKTKGYLKLKDKRLNIFLIKQEA